MSTLSESASYVVRPDLIFIACHFDEMSFDGEFYSEHDEIKPEEVRLLASHALAVGAEHGSVTLYPHHTSLRIQHKPDLTDPRTLTEIELSLREWMLTLRAESIDPPLPPNEYTCRPDGIPLVIQDRIFQAIKLSDHLLLRGLSTFLKAAMLSRHRHFSEEAHYCLYISLDASKSLIDHILQSRGLSNPSAHDAGAHIHEVFGEEQSGMRYFEEFYDDRIRTMHPKSRFGTFVFAPTSHSDFFMLRNSLRDVYRYLILGEVLNPQESANTHG